MMRRPALFPGMAIALWLGLHASSGWCATAEVAAPPQIDAAPCLAAVAAGDDDKILSRCAEVIDRDKTERADRIKALIARGGLFARRNQIDEAVSDYDAVLRLDPTLADIFNARGELWRRKGDRVKALRDFDAALKLNPAHAQAKANYKALAQELERLGAQMAVAGKPSFNCARARRAVEKAICANPELADLDREIYGSHVRALREAASVGHGAVRALQRQQDEFTTRRNAAFGRPGYDLKKAMRERLQEINGIDGY